MTPEQRAQQIWDCREIGATPGHIVDRIAAAIHNAVGEEREACLQIVQSVPSHAEDGSSLKWAGIACAWITAAIRAR